ncbi:hypothetical protein Fot_24464 [Forsythia ovata]|uniref:Uncharacterized protein n=1 Tax=Forsythia ovata TaxID=205694 RepID=A0ABD1U6A6_9LAMI
MNWDEADVSFGDQGQRGVEETDDREVDTRGEVDTAVDTEVWADHIEGKAEATVETEVGTTVEGDQRKAVDTSVDTTLDGEAEEAIDTWVIRRRWINHVGGLRDL